MQHPRAHLQTVAIMLVLSLVSVPFYWIGRHKPRPASGAEVVLRQEPTLEVRRVTHLSKY